MVADRLAVVKEILAILEEFFGERRILDRRGKVAGVRDWLKIGDCPRFSRFSRFSGFLVFSAVRDFSPPLKASRGHALRKQLWHAPNKYCPNDHNDDAEKSGRRRPAGMPASEPEACQHCAGNTYAPAAKFQPSPRNAENRVECLRDNPDIACASREPNRDKTRAETDDGGDTNARSGLEPEGRPSFRATIIESHVFSPIVLRSCSQYLYRRALEERNSALWSNLAPVNPKLV